MRVSATARKPSMMYAFCVQIGRVTGSPTGIADCCSMSPRGCGASIQGTNAANRRFTSVRAWSARSMATGASGESA